MCQFMQNSQTTPLSCGALVVQIDEISPGLLTKAIDREYNKDLKYIHGVETE